MSNSESENKRKSQISPIVAIGVAFLIFAMIKMCAIDTLRIEGHSMEPSFAPGRIIFVNRLAFGILVPFIDSYIATWSRPYRNSVIVLKNPIDNTKLVKRCIAIPGDTIRIEDGILFIDSDATLGIKVGNTPFFMIHGETIVPENRFLVLGDNLDDSIDSRLFGFVQLDKITGSVIF